MRELKQRFWLRLTTWLTLTACFAVLAMASLVAMNLSRILTLWGDDLQITAYLEKDFEKEKIQKIEEQISKDPRVGKFQFVSREQALTDFKFQMASYAPDLTADEDLLTLIPPSFQISLASGIPTHQQSDEIAKLAQNIQQIGGIEEVRYGQEWIKKYSAILSALDGAAGSVGLVLALAALLVIGNAVRASIEARRSEIEVLELVGATSWMIRKPFLLEGALLGTFSALGALVLTAIAFVSVQNLIRGELQFLQIAEHLKFLPLYAIPLCVVAGGVLGAMASFLCVRRINNGWSAAGGRG